MRVVNETPNSTVVKRKVCSNCGVELEYVPADVATAQKRGLDNWLYTIKYITCPHCEAELILSEY